MIRQARPLVLWVTVALCSVSLEGCHGALRPESPEASRIEMLWWVMLAISTAVFIIVIALFGYALFRRPATSSILASPFRANTFVIVGGAVIPVAILAAMFGLMTVVMARSAAEEASPGTEQVQVIAHQWWYEVHYPNGDTTTNVVRVAAGKDTELLLQSADVIHSFWVPQLNGKTDMIPGKTNSLVLHPSRTGEFHGQCAEFCGTGHATMTITVVAEDAATHDSWLAKNEHQSNALAGD